MSKTNKTVNYNVISISLRSGHVTVRNDKKIHRVIPRGKITPGIIENDLTFMASPNPISTGLVFRESDIPLIIKRGGLYLGEIGIDILMTALNEIDFPCGLFIFSDCEGNDMSIGTNTNPDSTADLEVVVFSD